MAGIVLGRWSGTAFNTHSPAVVTATSEESEIDKELSSDIQIVDQTPEAPAVATSPSAEIGSKRENTALIRTADKAKDKDVRALYSRFLDANERNSIDEQNSLFAEMEALDPKHENVFQAKARFQEDDENWEGASNTYKECIAAAPSSIGCLRRLANIRTSTLDEKIKYGLECLNLNAKDALCLVDVAIALSGRGEYFKAKEFFERALGLPKTGEGYFREYILYHYGMTLKNLSLPAEAKKAFTESCRLKMKSSCDEIK